MIRHSAWFKIHTPFDLSASGTRKSLNDRLSATSLLLQMAESEEEIEEGFELATKGTKCKYGKL